MLQPRRRQRRRPTQCHAVAIDGRAAKIRRRHRHKARLRALLHRGEPERRPLLRRGRGCLAQKRYAIWGRLVAAQPEQVAYSIIDAKSRELFMPSTPPPPPVYPPVEADTLDGLAQNSGFPAPSSARRSRRSTPPAARANSTRPSLTASRPRASRPPRPTGRAPSPSRPSTATRSAPA